VPDFLYGPEFSVSFWFKSSGNAGDVYQYMFSHGLFNASNSLNIYFGENERAGDGGVIKTSLVDFDDAANDGALNIAAGMADGNWHHYVLTVVGSGIGASVYVDGILRNSAAQGGDTFDPEADLHLGARTDRNSQRFFGGALDDVRVYNGVLTTEEIVLLAGTSK
jgi:hypothetical protein